MRSAQDDDFVGVLKKNIPNKLAVMRAAPHLLRPMYAGANMGHPSREKGFVLCSNRSITDELSLGCSTTRSRLSRISTYSSRKVLAGSIPAIRRVGRMVAKMVTDASMTTTVRMVGVS
jgi:hypothetical protein